MSIRRFFDQYLMFIQQSAFGTGYGCTSLRMSEFPTLEFIRRQAPKAD